MTPDLPPEPAPTRVPLYAVVFIPLGVAAVAEELGQGARETYNQTYKSWGLALGELSDMATSGHPRWSDWADRSRRHTYEEWVEAITEVWARVWSGPVRHPSLSEATLQAVKDVPKLSGAGRRGVGFQPNLFTRANFREVAHEAARLAVDEWGTATANTLGTPALPTGDLLRLSSSGFPPCLVSRRLNSDDPSETPRNLAEFNDSTLSALVELCQGHPNLGNSANEQLAGYRDAVAEIILGLDKLADSAAAESQGSDGQEVSGQLEQLAVDSFENRAVDGALTTVKAIITAHRTGLKKFSQTRIGAALESMPRLTQVMERHCLAAGAPGAETWEQFSDTFTLAEGPRDLRGGARDSRPTPHAGGGPHAPSL
jgi:hypothetical protein